MKILRGMLLSMILIIFGSTTVFAEGTTEYSVDEIGIKFQVPDSILSYTRTSGISDDIMNALGYSTEEYKEHLISTMEEENTYFIAFDTNVNYRIYLDSVYSNKATYSMKSDEEILQLVDEGLDGELTAMGTEVKDKSVFSENDHKFAVVELTDNTGDCYLYATVEDHQAYYFYIRVYSGGITDAHRALIKQIAGSSEFFEKSNTPAQTAANTDTAVSEREESQASGNLGIISTIIRFAGIIIGAIVIVIILMLIVSRLSNRKRKTKVHYGTRRDAAYDERLKRIMGVDEESDK